MENYLSLIQIIRFYLCIKKIKIKRSKQKILVLGCGGAGKACIVSVINYFKNSQIQLFNRNSGKLKTFVKNIKIKNNNTVKTFSNLRNLKDLIIFRLYN